MGSANISLDNNVAYILGAILFKSTVCIVFLVFIQAFAAVQMSYAFIHVIYLRFSLRRGLEPVYFSKNYLPLFNYGENEK